MHRRSGLQIVFGLIGLVKSMIPVMLGAIILGVIGYLASIFLTIFGAQAMVDIAFYQGQFLKLLCILIIVCGVIRGFLRYGEQAANHYIAFKLLAMIRDKVFHKLRQLAPAKLDGKEKGNLISMITSDVELLEVFYAHTISPVMIALIVSIIMVMYISSYHLVLGLIALLGYISVGILLPLRTSLLGKSDGFEARQRFGALNSFVLESIYGLKEVDQFDRGEDRLKKLRQQTEVLHHYNGRLKKDEGISRGECDFVISFFSLFMFFVSAYFYTTGQIALEGILICTVSMMSSFGPVTALSSLANNLLVTFASGERVLSLLEEEPLIKEVTSGVQEDFKEMRVEDVTFKYDQEVILDHVSKTFEGNKIIGIKGKSGSGKSTLLKLLMRFYDPKSGIVKMNHHNIKDWQTTALRTNQSYVTQETYLFDDTILENVRIARNDASKEEVIEACKKANIHDFIMTLEKDYDTPIGSLGQALSGGQRQRIGLARAFLHDAPMILLDEPTSNLDSLNEAIILKTLKENAKGKTIVFVSHRDSSLKIADEIMTMESGRHS